MELGFTAKQVHFCCSLYYSPFRSRNISNVACLCGVMPFQYVSHNDSVLYYNMSKCFGILIAYVRAVFRWTEYQLKPYVFSVIKHDKICLKSVAQLIGDHMKQFQNVRSQAPLVWTLNITVKPITLQLQSLGAPEKRVSCTFAFMVVMLTFIAQD